MKLKKELLVMKIWNMDIINMRNIKLIKIDGVNFLCFTWFNIENTLLYGKLILKIYGGFLSL